MEELRVVAEDGSQQRSSSTGLEGADEARVAVIAVGRDELSHHLLASTSVLGTDGEDVFGEIDLAEGVWVWEKTVAVHVGAAWLDGVEETVPLKVPTWVATLAFVTDVEILEELGVAETTNSGEDGSALSEESQLSEQVLDQSPLLGII